ncbi:MAG: DUF3943 domain-containing protein [Deltaproteobacteria bacterium]|nr:DUF3943 domain-containing protein [Deltaproteobacteria bacterium]
MSALNAIPEGAFRRTLLSGAISLALLLPGAGFAEEPVPVATPVKAALSAVDNLLITTPPPPPNVRTPVLSWGKGKGKSYSIPAWEILGFAAALNVFGRVVYPDDVDEKYSDGHKVYSVTPSTIWEHLTKGPWGFDGDSFKVNQLQHPYQGAVYQGFARSAGIGFWESAAYTFLGSFVWEVAGETTRPSINDQVASGIGGSFLGEPLFRLASLVLEDGGDRPGFWRELSAAVLSPPTGFNRLVYGDRFKGVFPSHNPATFTRLRLGASITDRVAGIANDNVDRNEATVDYSLAYGLPGKNGYTYDRPFDYFDFQFTAVSGKNAFENIMTRGLLSGKKYEVGDDYRGVWGLYGSFDYISPQVFRVSSTALSLGTTGQWWLSRSVALQGSTFGGIGYGAGGTVHRTEERDYHYGATGHGLLAARLIFGDKAMFDFTGREYYISSYGSTRTDGSERIFRGNASFTVSVYKRHALGIQYVMARRDASSSGIPGTHQTVGTWSLAYNFLGDTRFGAVEWRPAAIEGR